MAFRTGDGLEVNGILVVDAGGNIQSVPSVAINEGSSAMDTTNLKLEVNGNASIRGANALFFGVGTNSYNSWKTKIWNNNTSTMYVNAQEFNVNNSGYGSVTFLKANASGVDGTKFRDLDNTAYYADPAGTSVFNGATFAATPTVNGNTVLTSNAGINANNINGGTLNNDRLPNFVHLGTSTTTGYATDDGNWGSRLNVSSTVHAKIEVSQQANSMRSHWYAHTGQDSIKFGTSTSHDVEIQRDGTTRIEATSGGATITGIGTATTDFRAPIFYDSSNTDFYIDPVGNSKLYGTLSLGHTNSQAGTLVIYDTGNNGMEIKGNGSNSFQFDMIGTGSTGLLKINDFNVGIGAAADASHRLKVSSSGHNYLWIEATSGTNEAMTRYKNPTSNNWYTGIRNGTSNSLTNTSYHVYSSAFGATTGGWNASGQFFTANEGYALGSFRAPIFYDSANTSYYTYPSSSSRLNQLRANVIQAGTNSALTDAGNLAVYDSGNPYISFHTGTARTAYIQELSGRFYFGEVPYTESVGSFRAPLFYDTNNTNYYLDPHSTSNLNTVGVSKLLIDGNQVLDMTNNSTQRGPWNPLVSSIRHSGRQLYGDEEFSNGNNNVNVYNNAGGNGVTITRVTATSDPGQSAPNSSGQVLKIAYLASSTAGTSPGYGGFYQTIPAENNHTFVQIFQAKLPAGKQLYIAENSQGNNATSYFLTNSVGTGKWEWYARVSHCGDAGTFSGGGHIYVGGGSGDFNWYLASCTCYDVTESHQLFNRQFIAAMDMRAPIFYDSVDTTYYEDPASSRVLKGLSLLKAGHSSSHNEVLRIGRTDDTYRYHSLYATNNSTASILEFRIHDGGNSTAQTAALSIRQNLSSTGDRGTLIHHGTRLGFDESGTRSWTMKAGSGALNLYSGDGAGHFQSSITGGFRAPIFYDTGNTGFFVNPAGSTKLEELNVFGGNNQSTNDGAIYVQKTNNNDWLLKAEGSGSGTEYGITVRMPGSHTYSYQATNAGAEYYRVGTDMVLHNASIRSPIFYDSNNTAYYLDASSTGTSLNVAGNAFIPGYANIAGVELSIGVTRSLNNIPDNQWVTIANFTGSRKQDIIEIHDDESGRHNMLKMQVAWSYGQGSIQIINGVRHSTRTINQVRMLYNTADRTYGTGKLQVYMTSWSTSRTLHIKQQAWTSGNWGKSSIPSTAETGLPSGYTVHEGTTLEANEDPNGTFGTTGRAVIGQGIDVFHGSPIKFHTTSGDGISTERGFIDAQEGGHLRIATSGGENIVFQDGGVGGTTNLTILGSGEMVKEATERFTIKSHTNSWDGGLRFYASDNSTIFQMHPDTNGQMYVDREWRFQNTQINYGNIRRGNHHVGHLEGSYNNIGSNGTKSNPIYTIGSSYNPDSNGTTLANMYGIGFTDASASFISGGLQTGSWGMYVAAGGAARVWLEGNSGRVAAIGDMRAPTYYDIDDTSYYTNPGSTTQSAKFRQHVSIGDGNNLTNDGGWGARLNLSDSVHSKIEISQDANSIKSEWHVHTGVDAARFGTSTNHHLELRTSGTVRLKLDKDGGTTNTGNLIIASGDLQTDRYDDQGGTFLFKKGSGSGRTRHLNLADTTTDPASVSDSNNPTGISWGQRSDNNGYYMLGLKGSYSNGLSTHSRLAIAWHTGVEIGGSPTYGGTRFFSDSPYVTTTEIMSVGKGDSHVRVINNLYAKAFYDIDSTSYYLNPASTSFLDSISVKVGAESTGAANSSTVGLIMRYGGSSYNNNTWAHKFHKHDHGGGVPLYLSETIGTGAWSAMQRWGSYSGDSYKNVFFSALKVVGSVDADAFYDRNDTQYMMDLSTNNNSLVMRGTIHVGPEGNLGLGHLTHPKRVIPGAAAAWSGSGTTTGQIVIDLPGTLANYDMLYFEVDVYEYSADNATKIIVGGHNWNSGGDSGTSSTMWHNVGVKVIGDMDKPIYFGWRNNGSVNKRVMVIGSPTSSWSYGTVRVSSVSGADDFYIGAIDYTGDWAVTQSTSSSVFTKSPTTDFNSIGGQTLKTHGRMAAYGYQGNGNVGGTGSASWHPSGIYSNGTNWLYGQIVMNNNIISGCRYIAVGADNSEQHIIKRNNGNNTEIRTHASGASGLLVRNGSDQFRFQLYGDGSNYGFLDGVWASWDLQKTTNGALYMNGNTSYYMRLEDSSTSINVAGAIVAAGNVTAFSDRRVKKDITPITNSLDKVQKLNGVTFRRTDLADKSKTYAGLIAQDVEAVLPEAVEGNSKKRVDYNAVIGLLVESIKELKSEVDDLKEQLKNK